MSQNKIYKYYSTMRYLDIGTFPKDCFELKNYETRKQVLPGIIAWGEVTYTRKLTEKELKDYELTEDVNKEEALQDIEKLSEINKILLNKKFYDKGINSIMKKMSELIQREQEKKAYKSDISKDDYKDFTFQKHIIEMNEKEAIRYYADKIVYDCITDCSENNRIFNVNEYDNNDFLIKNFSAIAQKINFDERVCDLQVDYNKKEIDMVFYLEYCPHYFQDDLDISDESRLRILEEFKNYIGSFEKYTPARWIRTNTRELINNYYISQYDSIEDKDFVYNLLNKELYNSGFVDKYIDGYTVNVNADNIEDLINILNEKIKELQLSIENGEIEDE